MDLQTRQQPLASPCAQILGKAEFLNPGGSIKDRVALAIVREAAAQGRLRRGGLITEGSAGALQSRLSVDSLCCEETVKPDLETCMVHLCLLLMPSSALLMSSKLS